MKKKNLNFLLALLAALALVFAGACSDDGGGDTINNYYTEGDGSSSSGSSSGDSASYAGMTYTYTPEDESDVEHNGDTGIYSISIAFTSESDAAVTVSYYAHSWNSSFSVGTSGTDVVAGQTGSGGTHCTFGYKTDSTGSNNADGTCAIYEASIACNYLAADDGSTVTLLLGDSVTGAGDGFAVTLERYDAGRTLLLTGTDSSDGASVTYAVYGTGTSYTYNSTADTGGNGNTSDTVTTVTTNVTDESGADIFDDGTNVANALVAGVLGTGTEFTKQ